jgi:dihydrodipicolinate synthase/N-acetylneuraminate lyase
MKLSGRIVPIATPLIEGEFVHEQQLRNLVDYLIEKGVHGFWANGGFGGNTYLRDEVQFRAMEIIIDQTRKRVPVLAGMADNSVTRVIDKAARMTALGPDALFLLPPAYDGLPNSQVIDFYQDVASHVELPLYIYHNHYSTHVKMDADSIITLSRHPNIVGIKDSSEDPYLFVALARHFKNSDFCLLAGTMPLGCFAMQLGFDGVVDPTDQVYTELGVAQFEAVKAQDWNLAIELQQKIDKVGYLTMTLGNYRATVEACLNMMGLCERIVPRPYPSLEDREAWEKLRNVMIEVGILPVAEAVTGD